MISVKSFPPGQRHYFGYLLKNNEEVKTGPWIDAWGCTDARMTLEGMNLGDEIVIYAANTVDPPKGSGIPLISPDKGYTKNLEVLALGYRWYRADHVKASGHPVTVHFLGWS